MKWPATTNEMRAEGWQYDNDSVCRGCKAPIEWWISPKGRKTPINVVPPEDVLFSNEERRELHFSSCPERDWFKK
jgi:hypothetical protein